MVKKVLLNAKQLAVLKWAGEGRPKGVYEDGFDHRLTARALERRGLLSGHGHGRSWRARLTDDGRYYVEHSTYPPFDGEPESVMAPGISSDMRPRPNPIDDLLERLEAAGGALRLEAPSVEERSRYARAVQQLRASAALSPGRRLRVSGTKRGPMTIELIEVEAQSESEPEIPVPEEADRRRSEVRTLAEDSSLLAVEDETRPRALALVQGISEECERRGWALTVDGNPSFPITVGEDAYRCVLSEERVKRDVYTEEDVAARKHEWQRVSPTRMEVWSGHLKLELNPGYGSRSWADRKRWTLISKLPEFFTAIEEQSQASQDKREKLAAYHAQQIQEWQDAVPKAREAYLLKLNAERAQKQSEDWRKAEELRAYGRAVHRRGQVFDGAHRKPALVWAQWIAKRADQLDPLKDSTALVVSAPDDLEASELDAYMPHHWTVRHPPEPPTWLPS